MICRPYYYFDLGCAAHLFGCGTLGKGAVVDARADDIDAYLTFAVAKNLRLTHVIDTHVHADHRAGGPELARRTGAQYGLHELADVTGSTGKPTSTLGFEKRWNAVLSLNRREFIDALADVPPRRPEMERVLAFNRGHAEERTHA
jgi:glyoxylase-like metal-dependent hydrolase (beta-lactamase superfamily II)